MTLQSTNGSDRIVGVAITEDPGNRARREHAAGEGAHDVLAPRGTARVTGLPEQPALTIDYDLVNGPTYLPLGRTGNPPAAIVDPVTAAQAVNGVVVLRLSPATTIALQVAGVAQRFPTAPPRFAVVGIGALAEQLAISDPSLMVIPEVWLGSGISNSAAATVRAAGAAVTTQSGVLEAMAVASARTWTWRSIGLAVLALLAVAGIAAAGLADDIARRTPAHPWQRIGVDAATYRTAVTRSVAVSSVVGGAIGAGISAPVAAGIEALLATDVLGTAATPPLATSIPAVPIAALVVVVITLTVAIANYRTRRVM